MDLVYSIPAQKVGKCAPGIDKYQCTFYGLLSTWSSFMSKLIKDHRRYTDIYLFQGNIFQPFEQDVPIISLEMYQP